MKKVGYFVFLILLVITFNVHAAADDCDKDELKRLKALASKIEFDYDYKMVDEKAVFSINAVNLNEDLRVLIIEDYYSDKYQEFKDNSTHKATLDNFEPGKKITITIRGYVPNWCSGKTVSTKTIRLPYYNYFYDEEKCQGNEDFKYCKQLINTNLTQEEFNKQFELFLKNKEKAEKPNDEKESSSNSTLYMIIGGAVLIIVIVVLLLSYIIKRKKKNEL